MATNGHHHDGYHLRHMLLPQTNQLLCNMTIIRDQRTDTPLFAHTTQKLGDLLISRALDLVPTTKTEVVTPLEATYAGLAFTEPVCGVSILRAGSSLEEALRRAYSGPLSYGKILIQRDEKTAEPVYLYSKFPPSITQGYVFILEPMLATGGSVCKAVELLTGRGVAPERIVIINVMTSRAALARLAESCPKVSIVTAAIDENLTSKKYIDPGLGDFGDRFYGT